MLKLLAMFVVAGSLLAGCTKSVPDDGTEAGKTHFDNLSNYRDGEAKRLRAGEVLFCNDLTGKGHVTRAITNSVAAFVNRPNS